MCEDMLGVLLCDEFAKIGDFSFKKRKLPKPCQKSLFGPLFERVFFAALQNAHRRFHNAARFLFLAHGIGVLHARKMCAAERFPRAFPAQRRTVRHTDNGAKFHERLAKVSRICGIDFPQKSGISRFCGSIVDIGIVCVQPAQNAQDIAVHCRSGQTQGNRTDRACRIIPYPRQSAHAFKRLRESMFSNHLRRPVQIARAGIIPEPLPKFEDFLLRCLGKRFGRRERFEKLHIALLDRLDARLLEHEFGYKRRIGISHPAPRQIPFANAVPLQKGRHRAFKQIRR